MLLSRLKPYLTQTTPSAFSLELLQKLSPETMWGVLVILLWQKSSSNCNYEHLIEFHHRLQFDKK